MAFMHVGVQKMLLLCLTFTVYFKGTFRLDQIGSRLESLNWYASVRALLTFLFFIFSPGIFKTGSEASTAQIYLISNGFIGQEVWNPFFLMAGAKRNVKICCVARTLNLWKSFPQIQNKISVVSTFLQFYWYGSANLKPANIQWSNLPKHISEKINFSIKILERHFFSIYSASWTNQYQYSSITFRPIESGRTAQLNVPSGQIGSAWEWYHWMGFT